VNTGFWGLLTGRADLINTTTGETFELKTNACLANPGCFAAAQTQLQSYVTSGGGKLTIGDNNTVFHGQLTMTIVDSIRGVQTTFVYNPNASPGLIGYTIANQRNVWFRAIVRAYKESGSQSGAGTMPFGPFPIWVIP
jgi:hypothetical protein